LGPIGQQRAAIMVQNESVKSNDCRNLLGAARVNEAGAISSKNQNFINALS
jgi:hypothetical protein